MKRTPLNRKTLLARKTPIRKRSQRKQKEMDATDNLRHAAIEHGVKCDGLCGAMAVDPHEITAGSYRHNAIHDPRAQAYLCRKCHKLWQGIPYCEQIAMVTRSIVASVNECVGSEAVTVESVVRHLL